MFSSTRSKFETLFKEVESSLTQTCWFISLMLIINIQPVFLSFFIANSYWVGGFELGGHNRLYEMCCLCTRVCLELWVSSLIKSLMNECLSWKYLYISCFYSWRIWLNLEKLLNKHSLEMKKNEDKMHWANLCTLAIGEVKCIISIKVKQEVQFDLLSYFLF